MPSIGGDGGGGGDIGGFCFICDGGGPTDKLWRAFIEEDKRCCIITIRAGIFPQCTEQDPPE